jgi:hypothetical protein
MSQPPPSAPPPQEPWGWTPRQRLGLGLLATTLLILLAITYFRRPARLDDHAVLLHGQQVAVPQRVDPNTATAQELARIPHLGEALAAKIITYREARKSTAKDGIVFRQPADLDNVPDIGKKLIEQFEPFLEFPEPKP